MVDFNSEVTVGTPATDIVRVLLLQKLENVSDAWEDYYKIERRSSSATSYLIRARLYTLYLQLSAYLNRTKKKYPKLKDSEKIIKDGDVLALWDMTKEYVKVLDELRILRLDTKKDFDHTSLEAENIAMSK